MPLNPPPKRGQKQQGPKQGQKGGRSTAALSTAWTEHKTTRIPEPSLKPLPVLPYHMTPEETEAWVKADTERQLAPKQPPPKQTFTEANKKWAVGFLTQPRQYELNKDNNYTRALKKKVNEAEPGSTSRSSPRKKRDVPQLGQQAKQTTPPRSRWDPVMAPHRLSSTLLGKQGSVSVNWIHMLQIDLRVLKLHSSM